MSETTHHPTPRQRPPETLPELDSLSLLGNPWLDRDSETTDWLAERYGALRASESGEGRGQV
jgi:hypothetical protein